MPRKRETLPENYNADFPKRLRELLAENGKSQKELAEAMGKTRQAIGYYADGSSSPDWEALKFIANYFEVSADYLLGLSDVRSPEVNMQIVCNYTGLSEGAIYALQDIRTVNSTYNVTSDLIENHGVLLGSSLCRVCTEAMELKNVCDGVRNILSKNKQFVEVCPGEYWDAIMDAKERLELALYRLNENFSFIVNQLYSPQNTLLEAEELINSIIQLASKPYPDSIGDADNGEHKAD